MLQLHQKFGNFVTLDPPFVTLDYVFVTFYYVDVT